MQPVAENQRPDLRTSLMNMSLVPRLPSFLGMFGMLQNPQVLRAFFSRVHNPWRLPRETTSKRLKVVRDRQYLIRLTSECASCHNGVHFFNYQKCSVLTSKCASRHNGVTFSAAQLPKVLRDH